MIRITPIRLIGSDNQQIGVIETQQALRMAEEEGLDLVEIVPDSRPPVCKIMDYGKFKYEQSKNEQKARAASKAQEVKEIRLGRSVKIDDHDIQIRIDQARRFLIAGHKVVVTQRYRGREMAHKELGIEHLVHFARSCDDLCKLEQPPRFMGRAATMVLAPDRNKVEAWKRRHPKLTKEEEEAAKAADAAIERADRTEEAEPAEA